MFCVKGKESTRERKGWCGVRGVRRGQGCSTRTAELGIREGGPTMGLEVWE